VYVKFVSFRRKKISTRFSNTPSSFPTTDVLSDTHMQVNCYYRLMFSFVFRILAEVFVRCIFVSACCHMLGFVFSVLTKKLAEKSIILYK